MVDGSEPSGSKGPGVLSLLVSAGMIALGIWRVTASSGRSTFGMVWGIALIAFGALGVMLFLLGRLFKVDEAASPEEVADKILTSQKRLYSGEAHQYRPASLAEFPHVDVGFYDRGRDRIAAAGFRWLGDFENLTLTREFPNMRTVIRMLLGDSGTVAAAVYHVRIGGWMRLLAWVGLVPRDIRSYDFETEFDDGTFVSTANTKEVDPTMPIPGIVSNRLPAATDPVELLRVHREAVRQALAANPGRRPTVMTSAQDVMAFQHRIHALKSAHRQKVGYTNAAELEAIQGRPLNDQERQVAAALERARYQPQQPPLPGGGGDPRYGSPYGPPRDPTAR